MLTSTNVPLRGTHHGWVLSHTLLPALSSRGGYRSHPVYLVSMSSSSRPSGGAGSGSLLSSALRKLEHHRLGQPACLCLCSGLTGSWHNWSFPGGFWKDMSVDSLSFSPFRDCDRGVLSSGSLDHQ